MIAAVRPTMRGMILMLTAAGCTGAALVNINPLVSMLAAGMLALLTGSLGLALFSLSRLELIRAPNRDAACGGMVQLPLVIANRSRRRRQAVLIRERLDFTEKSPFFHEAVAALHSRPMSRLPPALRLDLSRAGPPQGP
ncbi:MAG: hypothetical protein PHQ27_10280 [Victivallales bacterium]|nr:hypothetical protein [Victivallales bacterium]